MRAETRQQQGTKQALTRFLADLTRWHTVTVGQPGAAEENAVL